VLWAITPGARPDPAAKLAVMVAEEWPRRKDIEDALLKHPYVIRAEVREVNGLLVADVTMDRDIISSAQMMSLLDAWLEKVNQQPIRWRIKGELRVGKEPSPEPWIEDWIENEWPKGLGEIRINGK
jgi:hypothetical protein